MALLTSYNILASDMDFALWQLRYTLEEEPSFSQEIDCRTAAAAQWILQAGQAIFRMILQPDRLRPGNAAMLEPGKLYSGEAGYSLDRWQFWKMRLIELRSPGLFTEEWNVMTDKAIEYMNTLEKVMIWGNTPIYWDR
jgi:hypothetical protein